MSVTGPNAGIEKVRLNGELLTANLTRAVIGDATIRRTIEGASELSLTVSDPDGKLRRRPFLDDAAAMVVDDLRFRLVKVSKSGDDISLTGEDEVIYRLRQKKGPKKALRDKTTRAQFVKRLVKEAAGKNVRFYSPELTIKQPIAKAGKQTTTASDPAPGIDRNARGLTVKGVPATLQQKKIADQVIRLAMTYNPPRRAVVALLTACIVESVMGTVGMTYSTDGDSIGLLQARTSYISRENALSIPYNVRRFMLEPWTGTSFGGAIKQAKAGRAPGDIAQSIQGSAFPERYALYVDEANEWIDAYFGGEAGSFGDGGRTITKPYEFQVKKNEDYWTAIKRLAEEVNWRAFVVGNTFYFVAEPTLLEGRRRMFIREETRGIDQVDWEIDAGKKANSATVTGRIGNWDAPPGTVAVLDESHGPARGKWLVAEIDGNLSYPDVSITLKRASKPKPEPAPETETVPVPTTSGSVSGGAGSLDRIRFVSFESGAPYWGGSRAFFNQLIKPYTAEKHGYPIRSEKRSQTGGSDHAITSVNAYAVDFGTSENYAYGAEIGRLLGVPYRGREDDYKFFSFSAGGRRWRVQIICQTHGTGPHAHIGIARQ